MEGFAHTRSFIQPLFYKEFKICNYFGIEFAIKLLYNIKR